MDEARNTGNSTFPAAVDLSELDELVDDELGLEPSSTADILEDSADKPLPRPRSSTEYSKHFGTQTSLDLCEHCDDLCDESCADVSNIVEAELVHPYDKIIKEEKRNHTTTGVIRIMRANGDDEAADLLEEIRGLTNDVSNVLDGLSELHKRRTGSYPRLSTQTNDKESK